MNSIRANEVPTSNSQTRKSIKILIYGDIKDFKIKNSEIDE
jgi:hypothetical protein